MLREVAEHGEQVCSVGVGAVVALVPAHVASGQPAQGRLSGCEFTPITLQPFAACALNASVVNEALTRLSARHHVICSLSSEAADGRASLAK